MYPLVKEKLKETERKIRQSDFALTTYQCGVCNEYYDVFIPLISNGLPICRECWDLRQQNNNEKTHTEN